MVDITTIKTSKEEWYYIMMGLDSYYVSTLDPVSSGLAIYATTYAVSIAMKLSPYNYTVNDADWYLSNADEALQSIDKTLITIPIDIDAIEQGMRDVADMCILDKSEYRLFMSAYLTAFVNAGLDLSYVDEIMSMHMSYLKSQYE